ncbi:MAG: hypothetical protein ACYSWU_13575 [Planctomycetota bacterium]|jgi:hypothetical protein
MSARDCDPPKWLVDCTWEVYRLTCTDQARDKFRARIRHWAEEDMQVQERVKSFLELKGSLDKEDRSGLFGPPPFFLGPKLTLPAKYVISALVHNFFIDRTRERAGEHVLVLDPWAEAEDLVQTVAYGWLSTHIEDDTVELQKADEEKGKPSIEFSLAELFQPELILLAAQSEQAKEAFVGMRENLVKRRMERVKDEHQDLIRAAVEAVRGDLGEPPSPPRPNGTVVKGVSLQDAAAKIRDGDPDGQRELVRAWRGLRNPKLPKPIGKCPNHSQRNLYEPAALIACLKKVEGEKVDRDFRLNAHFRQVSREPRG